MGPTVSAVGRGVAVALAVAVPAALLAQAVDAVGDGGASWIAYPLALVVLVGSWLGGRTTARAAATRPVLLAAATGLVAIAAIQLLGVIRRWAADDDVAWRTVPVVTALGIGVAAGGAALTVGRAGRTRQ